MEHAQRRGLARLMLLWPEHRDALRAKVPQDIHLMELCEAYEAACEAVLFWSRSQEPFAPSRVEEYRELALGVEQDILVRLGLC